MPKISRRKVQREPLPENFEALEEFWAFWDSHSTADYEDLMEDVDIEVDIRSEKVYCAIAKEIAEQIQTEARRQGVSAETLVNLWLKEKLLEAVRK